MKPSFPAPFLPSHSVPLHQENLTSAGSMKRKQPVPGPMGSIPFILEELPSDDDDDFLIRPTRHSNALGPARDSQKTLRLLRTLPC